MASEPRGGRAAWVLAGIVVLVGGALLAYEAFADRRLTVIVISLDTTRPDHMSAYGYGRPTTPNLARLAREGARFDAAHSSTSWTLPAHMSLFTGLPPGLHDVNIDFQVLAPDRRTLGEIFKGAGYRTMGVFSAPYVHGRYGFSRGFDYYERGTQDPMIFDLTPAERAAEGGAREHRSHTEVTSKMVVDRAIALLRNSNADNNLLFLHFFDPHYDYMPPERLAKQFCDPKYRGTLTGRDIDERQDVWDATINAADKRQLTDLYDAELAWVDENIGRLLAELAAQDRLDRTLIVFVGDHGEEFYEHGRYGHRNGLSEQTLHIPLVVWGPGLGVPAGRTIETEVANYDVLPTLVDYAGLPKEGTLDGRSLRPLIEGHALPPRPVSSALTFIPRKPLGYYTLYRSIVLEGLKVVDVAAVQWSETDERKLDGPVLKEPPQVVRVYDIRADPLEQHDLADSGDPRVGPVLAAWSAEYARQLRVVGGLGGPATASDGIGLMESLEANGYLAHDKPEATQPGKPAKDDEKKPQGEATPVAPAPPEPK
jgi:arylsulfatase A-like enzyme